MTRVCNLEAPLTQADIVALFQTVLGRNPENINFVAEVAARGITVEQYLKEIRVCTELRDQIKAEIRALEAAKTRDPLHYRCPGDLAISKTDIKRVLLFGSCLMDFWKAALAGVGIASDQYLIGTELPECPIQPILEYDCQIIHPSLRHVIPDVAFARLAQSDREGHQALFQHCITAMQQMLAGAMRWNRDHCTLTFVLPFLTPQQNAMGRLLPRYDLSNPVYFIEKLNEKLASELQQYESTYFFDLNEVIATHGSRFVKEDTGIQFNHGSFATNFDAAFDVERLEKSNQFSEIYELRTLEIVKAAWFEMVAMIRSIRGTDAVKLIVCDLDDTLWRGSIGELTPEKLPTPEGWPRGLWEALLLLKRRGILLAIISQNSEAQVVQMWDSMTAGQLQLVDFATHKIDWRPKSEKMAEILAALNLLPKSVVFIDDNPYQRQEVIAAFPEIRALGGDPFTWRHILLWAAELQGGEISPESVARTTMVKAQLLREAERAAVPRADFLVSLNVCIRFLSIADPSHPQFNRALELVNKTNQYNTTGERWTRRDLAHAMTAGLELFGFRLTDVYTDYGLVGLLMVDGACIRQFVMSCRVLGLDAEIAAVSRIAQMMARRGRTIVYARLVKTESNMACQNVFSRCGFTSEADEWIANCSEVLPIPAHISAKDV